MQLHNLINKISMKNNMMLNMNMPLLNVGFQNQMMVNDNILNNMNLMENLGEKWNLIFDRKIYATKIAIVISPEKTIKEAINLFKTKSCLDIKNFKFIFNGKGLAPNMKINESGLRDWANILVVEPGM